MAEVIYSGIAANMLFNNFAICNRLAAMQWMGVPTPNLPFRWVTDRHRDAPV